MVTDDIDRKTVARCEQKAGACLISSARLFFQSMIQDLDESNGCSLCFFAYRQDATNGKRKVAAMELETAYITNVNDQSSFDWADFRCMKRLADIIPVGDESGAGAVGITLRGFSSLGAPSWRFWGKNQPERRLGCLAKVLEQMVTCHVTCLHLFHITTTRKNKTNEPFKRLNRTGTHT